MNTLIISSLKDIRELEELTFNLLNLMSEVRKNFSIEALEEQNIVINQILAILSRYKKGPKMQPLNMSAENSLKYIVLCLKKMAFSNEWIAPNICKRAAAIEEMVA